MSQQSSQPSENSKAIVGAIKFFAACIILAAVVYSEILFLGIIGSLFPSGPLAIGAMIGAVTTGLSIIALCLGKSHWFRPGQQLIVAWIFTGIEVGVLIMNDILAYQLHTGAQLDQFTSTWKLFCVATPALSLVGWILLFYFSPERTIMHKRMELEDRQQKAKIDLDTTVHRKAMDFHYRAIDMVGSGMEAQIQQLLGPITELAARQKLAQIASDLTGTHISHNDLTGDTPRQLPSRIVDADPNEGDYEEDEVEEAASRDHVLDRTNVQETIDNEVKPLERKSWKDRVKETINFSTPELPRTGKETAVITDEKPITEERAGQPARTRRLGGDKDFTDQEDKQETIDTPELPENYLDWTDAQWKQAKKELDPVAYNELFDDAFPADGIKPTPKKPVSKKPASKKKVSRRKVLVPSLTNLSAFTLPDLGRFRHIQFAAPCR